MKKLVVLLFMIILVFPLISTCMSDFLKRSYDVSLKGYTDTYQRPVLTAKNFINGEYQKDYVKWWENHMVPRGILTRTYNQIRLSAFEMANRIVGDKEVLYEIEYIEEYFGLSPQFNYISDEKQESLKRYLRNVEEASQKLQSMDKCLVLYTTPNKCDYMEANIPKKYKIQEGDNYLRGIDVLKKEIKNYDISYVDGTEVIDSLNIDSPVFYPTGIHWSRPMEQAVSAEILQKIKGQLKRDIKTIKCGTLENQETPYWRDNDIRELINVWDIPKQTYYQYETITDTPDHCMPLGIMIQGDSFAEGLRKDIMDNNIADFVMQVFYGDFYYDEIEYKVKLENGWDDFPMQQYLDESDAIVIGFNELFIKDESAGFIQFLNEFLETYKPSSEKEYLQNLEVEGNYAVEKDKSFGFYAYEREFAWAQKYSSVSLKNTNITANGLEINIETPGTIVYEEGDTFRIFVNGTMVDEIKAEKSKKYNIIIPADKIVAVDDCYTIDIYAPKDFVPGESFEGEDDRILAVKVYYIGEVKSNGI